MHKRLGYIGAFLLIAAICPGTTACVRHTDAPGIQRPEMFWPNPPEAKRIEYVNAISVPEDLNIRPGLIKSVFRYIGGIPEVSIVSPYGVTRDAGGRLYVVDTFLRRVHVFDAGENTYAAFPRGGTTLTSPVDIAIDESGGLIYVTDSKQGVVKVFKDYGKNFDSEFGGDVFERPTGITVNRSTAELLVVDTLGARVFRFDLSTRAPKGSFGGGGTSDGMFHYPTLISVTPTGNIIVTDSLNFRVQVFSPEGRFLWKIGGMGDSPGAFSRPKGVASDSDGNIYVVDALFDNIQMFDKQGRLLMAFGEHGSGPGAFRLPTGLYIDRNDSIYVSDSSNRRIQVFKYLKEDIAK